MLSDSEKKVIRSYMEKLFSLLKERMALDKQIADHEVTVRSILALHEDEDVMPYLDNLYTLIPPEGFTDAIRKVLRSSEDALSAAEVRDKLPGAGFSLEGYSNPLASIHTILKRLTPREVEQTTKDGKTAYKWVEIPRIARPPVNALYERLLGIADAPVQTKKAFKSRASRLRPRYRGNE
jgi:hypothetical protein